MYSTNLIKSLQDKINSATTAEEVVYISEAIRKLNLGVVKTVATYSNLQSFFAKNGDVVFVEDEEALYFSVLGLGWEKIFSVGVLVSFGWGMNQFGRLGDNTAISRLSPVSVVGGFTDWVQVSTGGLHSVGLRSNGTAWAWGRATYGALGDGTNTGSRSSPVSVVGGFADWVQVSAGFTHSVGIRETGAAWSWGNGQFGALGDGTIVGKSSPVSVVGGFTDWVQVSVGSVHNIGLRENGTIWSWGNNLAGRLGDNTTIDRSSPVSVIGGFTDWAQVSAGNSHSIGLRTNGTAWAWGNNIGGKLGDGTVVDKSSPVSVIGGFTDWAQVSAGNSHSIGIRSNGTAWSWGGNPNGQLGDGTVVDKSSPVSVIGGFADWAQIDASTSHNLGLRSNGTAWAWGNNTYGKLGDNTTVGKSSPVSVVGGFTDWVQLSAGPAANHNIGIRTG